MDYFYYETADNLLMPVNHMEARHMIAMKLKERAQNLSVEHSETVFSIWAGTNVNCTKFTCVEDLDEWVSYLSMRDLRLPESKSKKNNKVKIRA